MREKKECQKVAFVNITSYETEKDAVQNIPTERRTNERTVVNVSPLAQSIEFRVKRNDKEAKKPSFGSNDVNDDVYSHLHEKEDPNIDENYDHTHVIPNQMMGDSYYGNLNTGRKHEGK
ncbi:uncharacterized protein LOC133186925 [Saccostrea echinata]|uniref:uncharacterized protein LOC133186925 n=1 Tax=Saccostrea echinata TaxID=191078 RepID=UPI002A80156B|nr:uncharacterized protein LOC133186925 [Saccostrea echinata]